MKDTTPYQLWQRGFVRCGREKGFEVYVKDMNLYLFNKVNHKLRLVSKHERPRTENL